MDQVNPSRVLRIPESLWRNMQQDVASRSPEEACGLLAGISNNARELIPITNELHSHLAFRMAPQELYNSLVHIEASGWELLAIYHSHPMGPDLPSQTDIAQAYYPEAVHLIWSGRTATWECRAFCIINGTVIGAEIRLDN